MAQAPPFHYQPSFNSLDLEPSDISFEQRQFCSHNLQQAFITPQQIDNNLLQANSMAQPFLFQAESQQYSQQRQLQQAVPQKFESARGQHAGFTLNDTMYRPQFFWGSDSISGHRRAFNISPNLEPGMLHEANARRNRQIVYPEAASQGSIDDRNFEYGGMPSRNSSYPVFPGGASIVGPDLDTNNSLSPKSSNVHPLTPELADRVPRNSDWTNYNVSPYPNTKISSPEITAQLFGNGGTVGFSGLPQPNLRNVASPQTAIGNRNIFHGLSGSHSGTRLYDSDYSFSQNGSRGAASWYAHEHLPAVMPFRSNNLRTGAPAFNSLPNAYIKQDSGIDPLEGTNRGGSHTDVAGQGSFQDRSQVSRSPDLQVEHRSDDDILVDGKRDGLTYKEIRKMMHTKCAESTLRGRYRSLTKARKDRVRKPVWKDIDLRLLQKFVQEELDRIDESYHHPLNYTQQLSKVQWKKVADDIASNGGSYHFGNSTCKRKWVELNPSF
ncbi:hypothetical protein GQ44DRAFT_728205 [Phaeosphaeriaceae sp. PMI808]|nr:hypothetical protein GQ44DRAFT_728205 [Phaeosphaeriaceae sp. PMI808]